MLNWPFHATSGVVYIAFSAIVRPGTLLRFGSNRPPGIPHAPYTKPVYSCRLQYSVTVAVCSCDVYQASIRKEVTKIKILYGIVHPNTYELRYIVTQCVGPVLHPVHYWCTVTFFPLWRCDPSRVTASSFLRVLDHTQRRTTVGRTLLDEWSARHRDLYLTAHNTHNRQTFMPPVGFEPTISAGERPQTYAFDRAATGTGDVLSLITNYKCSLPVRIVSH